MIASSPEVNVSFGGSKSNNSVKTKLWHDRTTIFTFLNHRRKKDLFPIVKIIR